MILLTGGTGFVGSHIAKRLLAEERPLRCLVRDIAGLPAYLRYEAEPVRGDLLNKDDVEEAVAEVDTIIHLVGIIRETREASFEGVHVRGTRLLLEKAREAGVQRFIHMSALGARPESDSRYCRTKWLAEESVRKSGLEYTIFRPSVIFGPEDEFVNLLADLVRRMPILPRFKRGRIQPIWVEDVAACFTKSLDEEQAKGRAVELGGPEAYSPDELMDLLEETLGKHRPRIYMPAPMLYAGAAVMELLPNPPLTREQAMLLGEDNTCDIGAMVDTFGLRPRALDDYLREHFGAGPQETEAPQ